MSFFRKKKEVDLHQQEKVIDKEIADAKSLAEKTRTEEEPPLKEGEVRVRDIEVQPKQVISDETSRERNRLKYKDTTGLVTSQEKNSYPTFHVYYLGRIPTSIEYGKEAVEGPVDQLCRLRDKQKLPRVAVTFDTEGLTIKEMSSSLFSKNKNKKDGIDVYIPLHHITYGVASEGHPMVFACVSRMTDDDTPQDDGMPVLMLYAFLCDKADIAQQITYWQLQAYIEAYEELKRKKILRNRRKQALGSRQAAQKIPPTSVKEVRTDPERPLPIYPHEPPPPMEEENAIYAIPKKGHKVKNKGYKKPQSSDGDIPNDKPNGKPDSDNHVGSSEPDPGAIETPSSPTQSTRSDSITSEDSQSGSRDLAFERRISEMNDLMLEVDAEKLKKLMISNHASLAREIYFSKGNPNRISAESNGRAEEEHDNSNV